jgi:predicted DNA-binding protein YlxM (UPF0122 family)
LPKKISPFKVSKIISYYLEGYSQPEIASKLNIDQSTVSKQISKFKAYAEQYGINAAIEEYGVMDIFDALHDLAVDLQANHLTVEEAAVGLKMVMQFEKLGIKEKDYQDVIQAATKMKTEGFISSAVELNKLEQSTGMTHKEIVDKAVKTNQQLEQKQVQLNEVTGKLNACEQDLTAIESKKKKASQDLEEHMKQVGVDTNRLKKVEHLAVALKKRGVSRMMSWNCISRGSRRSTKLGLALMSLPQYLKKLRWLLRKTTVRHCLRCSRNMVASVKPI